MNTRFNNQQSNLLHPNIVQLGGHSTERPILVFISHVCVFHGRLVKCRMATAAFAAGLPLLSHLCQRVHQSCAYQAPGAHSAPLTKLAPSSHCSPTRQCLILVDSYPYQLSPFSLGPHFGAMATELSLCLHPSAHSTLHNMTMVGPLVLCSPAGTDFSVLLVFARAFQGLTMPPCASLAPKLLFLLKAHPSGCLTHQVCLNPFLKLMMAPLAVDCCDKHGRLCSQTAWPGLPLIMVIDVLILSPMHLSKSQTE